MGGRFPSPPSGGFTEDPDRCGIGRRRCLLFRRRCVFVRRCTHLVALLKNSLPSLRAISAVLQERIFPTLVFGVGTRSANISSQTFRSRTLDRLLQDCACCMGAMRKQSRTCTTGSRDFDLRIQLPTGMSSDALHVLDEQAPGGVRQGLRPRSRSAAPRTAPRPPPSPPAAPTSRSTPPAR